MRWDAVAFWNETLAAWRAAGALPKDTDPFAHFGIEPRPGICAGLGLTWMSLSGPAVKTRVVSQDAETRVVEDDLGAVRREYMLDCSMPQFIRFPVESPGDWERKIKPRLDPTTHDYGNLAAEAAESRESDDPWGLWMVGLYAFCRNFWGEEKLAYAYYDFPQTLHDMAKTWLRMHLECTPRVLDQARIDYVMFHEDMAFKNGPLIGPHLFDEFMAPYYRELFAHLRGRGQTRFLLDSDGFNGLVLDRFVDLGMNGLFPFEVAAGYDIREVRKRYPRFMIWGGLDKRVLNGTRDQIRREVLEKVPAVWESGGFIPSLDHACQPCPQANFEYYLELLRGLF